MRTHHRTCPLCEATCGVTVTVDGDRVVSVRGDADDVFSAGYICPKGVALGELHHDPDRLRHPLVRDGSGALRRATWDTAFDVIRQRLGDVLRAHGPDAVAVYLGNPNSHNVTSTFYVPALIRALGTGYRFSASTVDQMPKQVSAGLMFGTELSVPIPDIDRTDLFVVLGANPLASNGSLFTVPDFPGRLRALKRRGGRMIVIDPVRTRTAAAADEHLPIRPGSDALWLAAVAHVLLSDGRVDLGAAADHIDADDVARLREALRPFPPETVAATTGIDAATTRRIAEELRSASAAAVYGRIGTTTAGLATDGRGVAALGTVASWLVDVVNVLIGALDRPGGVMWPLPPAGGPTTEGTPGTGRGVRIPGSRRTRVRGLPSALGEFPVAALAEEIDTPDPETGERVRAFVNIAGNPVVSTPDGTRLERALPGLDLFVSLDAYVTETSRHSDVILPAPSPLARRHYDVVFANLAVRNTARWAGPTLPPSGDERDEGQTLLQLAAIAAGARAGQEPTVEQMDDLVAFDVARRAAGDPASRAHGRDVGELLAAVAPQRGIERLLDLRLRSGPYGDGFGSHPGGLTFATVRDHPHGVDLGPMRPRLPEVLRTPSGRVELAPPQLVAALAEAESLLRSGPPAAGRVVIVGRRQLRSNNSWMHNVASLAGGSNRCTLLVHPADAARFDLADGGCAQVTTETGSIRADVSVTDAVAEGVVCLPHGWGHRDPATWGAVAREHPGVNLNAVVSAEPVDPLSGNAVLSGIPARLAPAAPG